MEVGTSQMNTFLQMLAGKRNSNVFRVLQFTVLLQNQSCLQHPVV